MIGVTGASGKLGRHVMEGLLEKLPAAEIVALVRDPAKVSDIRSRGVTVRQADYSQPDTLQTALAGIEKLLLISSSEVGQRTAQHQAVVDAARTAGVKLLAYTSILRADTCTLVLAPEHKATEEYILASGLPFVFLRNGWYLENHTEALGPAVQHGAMLGAAGSGRFASAARSDYAQAAVVVLTSSGHEGKIYELAGDTSYNLAELAAEASRTARKPIVYNNLTGEAYEVALTGFGLPAGLASALADADLGAKVGQLDSSAKDLSSLIARPSTTLAAAVAAAIQIHR